MASNGLGVTAEFIYNYYCLVSYGKPSCNYLFANANQELV